ncbi:hypothetical protein LTR84_002203 [Exophiala bonariae]|uniref:EngB-type G domain-containing protein n=1 Tax=Exophiala bonariae TaxID=1690606 RepID=A0AAV9NEB0_9EURO|nr:hypothetical protein LTR84_002203 [Exophiala bonariae]
MQGTTCTSCRAISRTRFHLRLFFLKDSRRRLHSSSSRLNHTPLQPQSWYWETEPPSKENLAAAENFFRGHRPFREWTGTGWRRHKASTPGALLLPEIIVLGRSNVGKSSLLNRVTYSVELNRVSQTPGATKTMWAWSLAAKNEDTGGAIRGWGGDCSSKLTLVDLPGYGYGSDAEWGTEIVTYMKNRKELRRAYVVVDALQGITQHDRKILEVLRSLTIPYQLIVSKCDKSGWQGSQTAIESALRPIREEAELGSNSHAGLGELLLVGGLNSPSLVQPYGIQNVQWSFLRATGLDKYAMSHAAASSDYAKQAESFTPYLQQNSPTPSQPLTARLPQGLSAPAAAPRPPKTELSLQDFLAELLNVKPDSSAPSQRGTNPPSSRVLWKPSASAYSETQNPVDRKLMDLIAASRSTAKQASPELIRPGPSIPSSRMSSTRLKNTPIRQVPSVHALARQENRREVQGVMRSTPALPPRPVTASTSVIPHGKGVSHGIDAFESMFAAEQGKANNMSNSSQPKSKSKSKNKSKSKSKSSDFDDPPAPEVSMGKGVVRGMDAFESMFGGASSNGGGSKKQKKRQ